MNAMLLQNAPEGRVPPAAIAAYLSQPHVDRKVAMDGASLQRYAEDRIRVANARDGKQIERLNREATEFLDSLT